MFRVIFFLGLVMLSCAAPKSRNRGPQLVYDQKQKGDYNIQVHLKNFQVIALIGEENVEGLGDYDYNYDYGDFTIKPSGSVTSSQPSSNNSVTTVKPAEEIENTSKDTEKSTVAPEPEIVEDVKPSNSEKPVGLLGEPKPDDVSISDKPKPSTTKDDLLSTTTQKLSAPPVENGGQQYSKPVAADAIPGQIQVQVLQSPEDYTNFAVKKSTPNERIHLDSSGRANEKKCSSGFMKDKKGRCRRLRRPQSTIPFDFGRLAHLAARFRSAVADGSSSYVKNSPSGSDKH